MDGNLGLSPNELTTVPVAPSKRPMTSQDSSDNAHAMEIVAKSPLGTIPYSKQQVRKELLKAAGISDKRVAKLTKRSVEALENALKSNKKTYSSFEGEITDERSDPDHAQRTKAAEGLLTLFDVYPSKQEGLIPSKVKVDIQFPDWAKPKKPVDVQFSEVKSESQK